MISPERLKEIKERCDPKGNITLREVYDTLVTDIPDLVAEVERLRKLLDAWECTSYCASCDSYDVRTKQVTEEAG